MRENATKFLRGSIATFARVESRIPISLNIENYTLKMNITNLIDSFPKNVGISFLIFGDKTNLEQGRQWYQLEKLEINNKCQLSTPLIYVEDKEKRKLIIKQFLQETAKKIPSLKENQKDIGALELFIESTDIQEIEEILFELEIIYN